PAPHDGYAMRDTGITPHRLLMAQRRGNAADFRGRRRGEVEVDLTAAGIADVEILACAHIGPGQRAKGANERLIGLQNIPIAELARRGPGDLLSIERTRVPAPVLDEPQRQV